VDTTAAADLGLLLLRSVLGVVMVAHGANHVWGGGRIPGTARWFESLGMRPGRLHAWTASITELGAGTMLVVGLVTPLAAAGVVGVMLVAWVVNHRGNGFFTFRPGEGWEYVMTLTVVAVAVAVLGAGGWSLDAVLALPSLSGWTGLGLALGLGGGAAGLLLAVAWRPRRTPAP
jgi:putative oxidoreductase